MTQKDRLIELLHDWGTKNTDGINADSVAEHLLENNVMVLPCKVGGKAVMVFDESGELFITDGWVAENILITENETVYNFYCSLTNEYERRNSDDFGKTIFLTREEAEKALKGGAKR